MRRRISRPSTFLRFPKHPSEHGRWFAMEGQSDRLSDGDKWNLEPSFVEERARASVDQNSAGPCSGANNALQTLVGRMKFTLKEYLGEVWLC